MLMLQAVVDCDTNTSMVIAKHHDLFIVEAALLRESELLTRILHKAAC